MNFFSVNTLAQVERLKKNGLPREQAVAIVQSQHEVFEHTVINALATKADLSALRSELRHEMIETKTEIIKWVTGLMLAQSAVVSALVKLF